MKRRRRSAGWMLMAACFLMVGCGESRTGEKPKAAEEMTAQEGIGADGAAAEGGGRADGADGADKAGAGEGVQEAGDAGTGDGAQKEREQSLYGLYIQIGNQMAGHFQDVIDRYFQRVDHQEKFTLLDEEKECLPVGEAFYEQMEAAMERIGQKAERSGTLEKAGAGGAAEGEEHRAAGGSDALDAAYQKLHPVMWELAKALDQAEAYTSHKAHEPGEKEQEEKEREKERLHAVIWRAGREYEVLSVLFLEELDKVADAWEEEELGLLQEKGLDASYSFYAMVHTAKTLREAIDAQGIDDRRIEELDVQALQPLYEQYVEESAACLDYLEDKEDLEKEGYRAEGTAIDAFKEKILELNMTLAELFWQEGDQQTAGGTPSGQQTAGGTPSGQQSAGGTPSGQQSAGGARTERQEAISDPTAPLIARDGLIYRFEQDLSDLIDAHNALFEG